MLIKSVLSAPDDLKKSFLSQTACLQFINKQRPTICTFTTGAQQFDTLKTMPRNLSRNI